MDGIRKSKKSVGMMTAVFKKSKRQFVNLLFFLGLIVYSIAGGAVFYQLEHAETERSQLNLTNTVMKCSSRILRNKRQAKRLVQTCFSYCDIIIEQWTFVGGIIFALASITTIGYGALRLITHGGQIFYIVYCIIGMPLGLVFLANLGKFMEEAVGYIVDWVKKYKKKHKTHKIKPKDEATAEEGKEDDEEEEEEEFEIGGLLFLGLFFFYIALGVTGMCLLLKLHVIDGIFINFMSMTAVDANDFFSFRGLILPISIIYVIGGLALATVAIGVLGNYLRQLHNLGKKLKNSGKTKIYFGGQTLSVKNLVRTVGDELGVDPEELEKLDLDTLIEARLNPTEEKEPKPETPEPEVPKPPKPKKKLMWKPNKAYEQRRKRLAVQKLKEARKQQRGNKEENEKKTKQTNEIPVEENQEPVTAPELTVEDLEDELMNNNVDEGENEAGAETDQGNSM